MKITQLSILAIACGSSGIALAILSAVAGHQITSVLLGS